MTSAGAAGKGYGGVLPPGLGAALLPPAPGKPLASLPAARRRGLASAWRLNSGCSRSVSLYVRAGAPAAVPAQDELLRGGALGSARRALLYGLCCLVRPVAGGCAGAEPSFPGTGVPGPTPQLCVCVCTLIYIRGCRSVCIISIGQRREWTLFFFSCEKRVIV